MNRFLKRIKNSTYDLSTINTWEDRLKIKFLLETKWQTNKFIETSTSFAKAQG